MCFFSFAEYHELLPETAVVSNKLTWAAEAGLWELADLSTFLTVSNPIASGNRSQNLHTRAGTLGEALARLLFLLFLSEMMGEQKQALSCGMFSAVMNSPSLH